MLLYFEIIVMNEKIIDEYKDIVRQEWNYYAFVHNWLNCRLIRHSWHWNGYVWVPKKHWAHWMHYNYYFYGEESQNYTKSFRKKAERINSIVVHGWLTRAEGDLHMQPEKDLRWFWFDTAHLWDLQIVDYWFSSFSSVWVYRDKEYVIGQTKSLAEQLTAPLEA